MKAFDEFENFSDPQSAPAGERELLPDGTYQFKIMAVRDDEKLEIDLAPDDRRYGWVFCKLQRGVSWASAIKATLRTALGMTDAEWSANEVTDLASRRIGAEVYQKVGKNGRTYVNVRLFVPAEQPQQEPVKKSPPRTAGEKAIKAAMETTNDDIPF